MQNICLITYTHIDQQQQQTRGLLLLQQQPLKPGIEADPSPNQSPLKYLRKKVSTAVNEKLSARRNAVKLSKINLAVLLGLICLANHSWLLSNPSSPQLTHYQIIQLRK